VFQNGIKTDRDDLFFAETRAALESRMRAFFSPNGVKSPFRATYRVEDSSSYKILARRSNSSFSSSAIRPCLYRPFDKRWLYYEVGLTSRPAFDVMRHVLDDPNLVLLACRQQAEVGFRHVFVADSISDHSAVSLTTREITSAFPLWLAPGPGTLSLVERTPNFTVHLADALKRQLGRGHPFTPEHVFGYIYAILHSPHYRQRHAELLRIGFPRVPFTASRDLFRLLADFGNELVSLHLLQSSKLRSEGHYRGPAEPEVEGISYARNAIWLDQAQSYGFDLFPRMCGYSVSVAIRCATNG